MNVASSLLILSCLAFADDPKTGALLQTLPTDGSWATYQVNVTGEGKDVSLTWTLRSVGTVLHEGNMCRYLELEQSSDNGPQEIFNYALGQTIWRIVIPEAAFGEGKDPLAKAVRIWFQPGQNDPVVATSIEAQDPILAAIVRGPVANLKTEDQLEKINWQRGELSCAVVSGNQEIDFAGAKLQLNSRVLRHRDVPFSVGGLRQEIKAVFGNVEYKVGIKATLRDYGTDAKAKLPQLVP